MQRTIVDSESAVHAPIIVVNKTDSVQPFSIGASVGSEIFLDASETQRNIEEASKIEINKLNDDGSIISFTTPSFKQACLNIFGRPNISGCKSYHIV